MRLDTNADSGINDQLIKLHNTHSWIRFVSSSSASDFVIWYFFQHKILNTMKLLNHMAPSVELIMKRWAVWYW